jgi:hypothetical protein
MSEGGDREAVVATSREKRARTSPTVERGRAMAPRVAWLLLLVAVVVWLRSWPPWESLDHARGFAVDFGAYHAQVQRVFEEPLRIVPAWVYPPVAAVAFLVFRPFPLAAAKAIWIIANLAFVFLLVRGCARELRVAGRTGRWAAGLALVALSMPVVHCLKWGQTSLAIALLVLVALRSRPVTGGVLLGLAAAVKIYPLGCLIGPVVRKRWRMIGVTLVATAVFAVVVPALVLGVAETKYFFGKVLFRTITASEGNWSSGHSTGWWGGQGLSASLERWFVGGGHVGVEEFQPPVLLPLPRDVVTVVFFALAAAIIAGTALALRRVEPRGMRAALLPLLAVTILVVPAWHHYFVFLPLVVATVFGDRGSSLTARGLAGLSAILAAAPLVLLADVPLAYFRFSQWGGTTLAALTAWIALVLPRTGGPRTRCAGG